MDPQSDLRAVPSYSHLVLKWCVILEISHFTEIVQYNRNAANLAWFCIATITWVIQAEKPHVLKTEPFILSFMS